MATAFRIIYLFISPRKNISFGGKCNAEMFSHISGLHFFSESRLYFPIVRHLKGSYFIFKLNILFAELLQFCLYACIHLIGE